MIGAVLWARGVSSTHTTDVAPPLDRVEPGRQDTARGISTQTICMAHPTLRILQSGAHGTRAGKERLLGYSGSMA